MKIAYVINSMQTGGAQRLVADLCERFVVEGDDVTLILLYNSSDENLLKIFSDAVHRNQTEPGIFKIVRLNLPSGGRVIFSVSAIRRLRRHLKNFDVIHAHLFPSIYLVSIACRGLKGRRFMTEHNTHNRRREYPCLRPIEKLVYSGYDVIIAISTASESSLKKWLGWKDRCQGRIITILNGINLSRFSTDGQLMTPYPSTSDYQSDCPHVEKGVREMRIVMTSRFVRSKDHSTVVKAMGILKKRFEEGRFDIDGGAFCPVLVLAGVGETLEETKKAVIAGGLENFVRFPGNVTDVPGLLRKSDIGVVSSHWEGFGLSAVEMMASGLPVIASDVPGLREVVKNSGIIFNPGDYTRLADELETLIKNPDIASQISRQCRKRAEKYDIHNTASAYRILYKDY